MSHDDELKQAIAAIKIDQKESGGKILNKILQVDRSNITAWLWMTVCVDNVDEKRYCLEQILDIIGNSIIEVCSHTMT